MHHAFTKTNLLRPTKMTTKHNTFAPFIVQYRLFHTLGGTTMLSPTVPRLRTTSPIVCENIRRHTGRSTGYKTQKVEDVFSLRDGCLNCNKNEIDNASLDIHPIPTKEFLPSPSESGNRTTAIPGLSSELDTLGRTFLEAPSPAFDISRLLRRDPTEREVVPGAKSTSLESSEATETKER